MSPDETPQDQVAEIEKAKILHADLDELYRLRGEFLADMHEVEVRLGQMLGWHFHIPKDKRDQFEKFVLRRMPARARIEALAEILRASESEILGPVMRVFRQLNEFRNFIAHSAYSPNLVEQRKGESPRWSAWSSSARIRGNRFDDSADALRLALKDVAFIGGLLIMVADEMLVSEDRTVDPSIDWQKRLDEKVDDDGVISVSKKFFREFTAIGLDGEPGDLDVDAEE